jgi:uncharacterized 2Fe-2S/4Fe-4S cluster protein (DUF4445 family)
LVDLGTNGEVALGNRDRILCASTAAGPAFEAGTIRMGMRAATGAIFRAFQRGRGLECHVIGGGAPRGICGSGLVDVVAARLESGVILPGGRLANGVGEFPVAGPVVLTQADVRELQLAKGAIASGMRLMLKLWGATHSDVQAVYLAGAFGNYVRPESAVRIGLLEFPSGLIQPAGNTALRGVKMALLDPSSPFPGLVEHVPLASQPEFPATFIDSLHFRSE